MFKLEEFFVVANFGFWDAGKFIGIRIQDVSDLNQVYHGGGVRDRLSLCLQTTGSVYIP